jgi:hypothetical protein
MSQAAGWQRQDRIRAMKKLLGVAFAGLLLTQAPAYALTESDVVAGCGGGQDCVQLVAEYVTGLKSSGQSAQEIDQLLADLVVDLASAAQGQGSAARNSIAEGIKTASLAFDDASKGRQAVLVAGSISRSGNTQIGAVSSSGT